MNTQTFSTDVEMAVKAGNIDAAMQIALFEKGVALVTIKNRERMTQLSNLQK